MPPLQSVYNDRIGVAFAGLIANTEPNVLISREVEGAAIPFGRAVAQGTTDRQVSLADNAADVFRGISVREQGVEFRVGATADTFPVGSSALIMVQGVIWVLAGATVAAGAAVYVVPGTGRFTSVSTSNLAIPRAIFDSSGVDGALVKIRLQ